MYQPLDKGLNVAVMHLAGRTNPKGYGVSADAPDTFEKLKAQVAECGRITVWDGASENTIFGDPEVNYAFRAWHDACHIAGNHDFSLEGERGACELQIKQLHDHYGHGERVREWANLIRAEVVGQAEYYDRNGKFPADQVAFAAAYTANPEVALLDAPAPGNADRPRGSGLRPARRDGPGCGL